MLTSMHKIAASLTAGLGSLSNCKVCHQLVFEELDHIQKFYNKKKNYTACQ